MLSRCSFCEVHDNADEGGGGVRGASSGAKLIAGDCVEIS